MPSELGPANQEITGMAALSLTHQNHVLSVFSEIHRRLEEIEALLARSDVASAFSQCVSDFSAVEAMRIEHHIGIIRNCLLAHLAACGIAPRPAQVSLRAAVQAKVTYLSLLVDDLRPNKMQAYGPLDAVGQRAVIEIQTGLAAVIDALTADLRGD
jgi:hypothetical protein